MMPNNIKDLFQRYSSAMFFILAYAISWSIWIPLFILFQSIPQDIQTLPVILAFEFGVFGPTWSAFVITTINKGKAGLRRLLSPMSRRRVGIIWYVFVLFGMATIYLAALAIYAIFNGAALTVDFSGWFLLPILFSINLVSAFGEEVGWRGCALPLLETRRSALLSSLIIGILWGFWHLPGFIWPTEFLKLGMSLPSYILAVVALSILFTWVYSNTEGSLLLVVMFHSSINTTGAFLIAAMPVVAESATTRVLLLLLVAAVVVLTFGPERLSRKTPR